jgi:hypothetical protein
MIYAHGGMLTRGTALPWRLIDGEAVQAPAGGRRDPPNKSRSPERPFPEQARPSQVEPIPDEGHPAPAPIRRKTAPASPGWGRFACRARVDVAPSTVGGQPAGEAPRPTAAPAIEPGRFSLNLGGDCPDNHTAPRSQSLPRPRLVRPGACLRNAPDRPSQAAPIGVAATIQPGPQWAPTRRRG